MNFDRFTHRVNSWLASSTAFALSLGSVLIWAVCGPVFRYSETWQLVINTSTTINTFWMAFVILSASKRDNAALQLKLDALITANEHVVDPFALGKGNNAEVGGQRRLQIFGTVHGNIDGARPKLVLKFLRKYAFTPNLG